MHTVVSKGPTLGEQIYELLKEKIVSGDYRPGSLLVESEVASNLNVSRTPVSNAFIMLRERGLLEYQSGRFYVAQLSLKSVIDLYQCRLAFDTLASRLAAEHITDADVCELEEYLKVWREADKEEKAMTLWVADLRFHEKIYALSHNTHLIRFSNIAAELLALYRRSSIARLEISGRATQVQRSREDVLTEHEAILDGLRARDSDYTEEAAREHIRRVIDNLELLKASSTSEYMEVGAT